MVGEFAIVVGVEDVRNKSSPSWTRFLGLTEGNSTTSTCSSATASRARLGRRLTQKDLRETRLATARPSGKSAAEENSHRC